MEKEQHEQTHSDKVAAELIKAIREGTAPWQQPWQPGEAMASAPYNPFTGNQYRGSNSLYLRLLGSQYDDPRWLTYKQAQDMGAQVRKGESGLTVQYVKYGEMRDVLDEESKPQLDENGEVVQKFHYYDRPRIFSARVFNAGQIDGMPALPPPEERLPPPGELNARIESILQTSGADIRHARGNRAYYSPAEDYIVLPGRDQFSSQADYYATVLHELGHWTGHESRLDRDLRNPFGSVGYAKEELRAEISSFMNAQRYGVPHDPGRHASYVANWLKVLEGDPQEIIHACADATDICNYIDRYDRHLAQQQTAEQSMVQSIDRHLDGQQKQQRSPQELAQEKTWLNVPYAERGQVKALGAKWDSQAKGWYAPEGTDLTPLQPWRKITPPQTRTPLQQARDIPAQEDQENRTYLNIPYNERQQAKALGARWDGLAKSWYAPEGTDLTQLQRWFHAPQEPQKEVASHALPPDWNGGVQVRGNITVKDEEGREYIEPAQANGTIAEFWSVYAERADGTQEFVADFDSRKQADALASELRVEVNAIRQHPQQEAPVNIAQEKTYLAVPYEDKASAKALGAKWDGAAKSWYAPEGVDLAPLQKWIPQDRVIAAPVNSDPVQEFALALAAAGLVVKDIQADGELHRVPVEGRPHGRDGAYKLHLDGFKPAGFIQNFVTGYKENWKHDNGQRLSPEEVAQQRAQLAAQKAEREREREKTQQASAIYALKTWHDAPLADQNHPYLVKKGLNDVDIVNKLGMHQDDKGNLLIPILDKNFHFQSLQRIGANGFKQFESGCKTSGGFFIMGHDYPGEYCPSPAEKLNPDKAEPIIIATGVATAASIHLATGEPVVVAFQDGNLKEVAEELKAMYPYRSFFIAGDNDQHNVAKGLKNSGLESAKAAAKAVGGRYAVPQFAGGQVGKEYSDYSDLHRIAGLAAVKRQLQAGLSIARGNVAEDKERHQAQKQSQERMQDKEVRQRKADEENAVKKRRSRSM